MSTCNRLDLQTLGSQPVVMPKNLPNHWSEYFWKQNDQLYMRSPCLFCSILMNANMHFAINRLHPCGILCLYFKMKRHLWKVWTSQLVAWNQLPFFFFFFWKHNADRPTPKFLSSREGISEPGISSLRFGYFSTIIQQFKVITDQGTNCLAE